MFTNCQKGILKYELLKKQELFFWPNWTHHCPGKPFLVMFTKNSHDVTCMQRLFSDRIAEVARAASRQHFKSINILIIKGHHGKNCCVLQKSTPICMCCKILVKFPAVLRNLCPCVQLPMCPIASVSYPQGVPIYICSISQVTPLPMWPTTHVPHCPCVKMLKRCQVVKKMSNIKKCF